MSSKVPQSIKSMLSQGKQSFGGKKSTSIMKIILIIVAVIVAFYVLRYLFRWYNQRAEGFCGCGMKENFGKMRDDN